MDNHYEHRVILYNIKDLLLKYIQFYFQSSLIECKAFPDKISKLSISSLFNHLNPPYGR